jgi:hypothetical protein
MEVPALVDQNGAPLTSLTDSTQAVNPANIITRPPEDVTQTSTTADVTPKALVDGPWGSWTDTAWCSAGRYLNGFSVRNEPPQGSGDDTALNAVAMTCASKTGANLATIWAHLGYWGSWSNWAMCSKPNYQIVGVRAAIEPGQGLGDDTAMNALEVCCGLPESYSCEITSTGVDNGWGAWTPWAWCPINTAACGLQVKVESPQGIGDDTALNGVNVVCCSA